MAAKGKRPMRALTAADKIDAIQRVNDGESKASVARDIGVPESTLRGWCKNEDKLRYMSTRHSTPDTDKSSDGDAPPDKRARRDPASPAPPALAAPPSPARGLDLSAAPAPAPHSPPSPHAPSPRYPDPTPLDLKRADAASASMSAISPLTGLHRLPGVAAGHLGMSFNEIATNLSLIAQLGPALAGSGARALRSVRSPKPSHASHANQAPLAPLNLSDKHRGKAHHADGGGERARARMHHAPKEPPPPPPVDDALWYWLKTQQAMLDLTAHAQLPQAAPPAEPSRGSPKPVAAATVAAAAAASPQLDSSKNTWFWQYYKQFGGATPFPAAHAPKEKSENILYSHLTKGKAAEEPAKATPLAASPAAADARSQARARTVLDDLLFNNSNVPAREAGGEDARCNAENEFDGEVSEALEHGEKFLAWLEACRDPSVTRLHVHQLRGLLRNIRTRAERKPQPAPPATPAAAPPAPAAPAPDRVSRRK